MKKNNSGYFITDCEYGFGNVFVLTGEWDPQYIHIFVSENISVLRISQMMGWEGKDISFIEYLPDLRGLEIYSNNVTDCSSIQALSNLEMVSLQCDIKNEIDFSVFKKLINCYLYWCDGFESLFNCNGLKELNIERYPHRDLSRLEQMTSLEILRLSSRKLESLHGIEMLGALKVLDLFECVRLSEINSISCLQQLELCEIESCRKIQTIKSLGTLKNLGKLVLNNCGDIESFHPLQACIQLREVYFTESTRVMDGDLSVFLNLPKLKKVWFQNRKHYSHTREALSDFLISR